MNHDTLPSNEQHGLARPSTSNVPKSTIPIASSTGPLLIINGSDIGTNESDPPTPNDAAMKGVHIPISPTRASNASEADADGGLIPTSDSLQPSRASSQGHTATEAATLQGLQEATAALETIKELDRTRELSAVARARKTAAFRSPHSNSARSRSAAVTPGPFPYSPKLRNESFDVTANSSRATSPTRTPSGRAKRRKKERSTVPVAVSSLLSMDANDRRRSARVAKATVSVTGEGTSLTPNLSQFGFSAFLENLVMGARDNDRRTRSGVRPTRLAADRAPAKLKRAATKNKNKEKDSDADSLELEAKKELFRQLCILSYQLQAELDMVPFKTLDQLEAELDTSAPQNAPISDSRFGANMNGANLQQPYDVNGYGNNIESQPYPSYQRDNPSTYQQHRFSPESSPEVSLMDSMKPHAHAYPSYLPAHGNSYYSNRVGMEEEHYAPQSPVSRPIRSNIMSISALMDAPAPVKVQHRSPTPTPPSMPWTHEDDKATQILQELMSLRPKIDTTQLDRLTKIVQLAAMDVAIPSRAGSLDLQADQPISMDDAVSLNPLQTLDTQQLFDSEENNYLEEKAACSELYETYPYLSSFDEVVDEWRAGELSRLRLELQYRRSEIERIWTCDRKLAWSTFNDDRAGNLYRKQAMRTHHEKWQAKMELDLLCVHRRKTRAVAALTEQIWLPEGQDAVEDHKRELYARYGAFVNGARHAGLEDPLVRGDLDKLRLARASQQPGHAQEEVFPVSLSTDAVDGLATMDEDEESVFGDFSSESEYQSDYSLSSAISSLPSFTSLSASPISFRAKDGDMEHEETTLTSLNADSDAESDTVKVSGHVDVPHVGANGIPAHAVEPFAEIEVNDTEPAAELKVQVRKQSRKAKKPPPPGARLWKRGQVQQDPAAPKKSSENVQHPNGQAYYPETALHPTPASYHGILDPQQFAQSRDQDMHYAEQQRLVYERQMYEQHMQNRDFYPDSGQGLYFDPHPQSGSVLPEDEASRRQFHLSYHQHHSQQQQYPHRPPFFQTSQPSGQQTHWPY